MNTFNKMRPPIVLLTRTVCLALMTALLISPLAAEPSFGHVKRNPVVGIMGLPEETEAIEAMIERPIVEQTGGFRFITGTLRGKKVTLGQVGYGKVSSAAGAAILLKKFDVDCLIFSGTAGALNPDYIQGDVVIADDLLQHDLGQLSKEGFAPWLASVPNDGMDVPKWLSPPDSLLAVARQAAQSVKLTQADFSDGVRHPRVWEGVIVTGDSFINDPAKSAELRRKYAADAVEMEGAAVAQVCYQSGVPFLVIRSLTDRADGTAFLNYQKFIKIASTNSAILVSEVVGQLKGEDLPAKDAPHSRQMWCLISGLGFASGSPYDRQFPAYVNLTDEQREKVSRAVFEKMLGVALHLVPAHKIGLMFQAGASGAGPVNTSAQIMIEATREQALQVAAILGYLGQKSVVMGFTESGPYARRALLLENQGASGWSDSEQLRTQWPELARLVPNLTPGFSRIRTPLSDGLLVIDTTGDWPTTDWFGAPAQFKKAAATLNLPLRVTHVSAAYIQVQNFWMDPAAGQAALDKLKRPLGAKGIARLQNADAEVQATLAEAMRRK